MALGRPTIFTQELADEICFQLAQGKSLRTVCKMEGMPPGETIFRWFREKPSFCEQYAKAKQEATDALAEEIQDISDEALEGIQGSPSDSARVKAQQLRIDTRKWIMAKMKPKKYGDKMDVTSDGKALPTPILGGLNVPPNVPSDNSGT